MRILLYTAVLLPFLTSCGLRRHADTATTTPSKAAPVDTTPADSVASLDFGGRTRTFHVYTPSTLDRSVPAPVVIQLHGGRGSGSEIDKLTGLNSLAEREGFIAVAPDGVGGNWNDGRTDSDVSAIDESIDDVGFLVAMIDDIATRHRVDPTRVYAMGISNGAMMANRLACERPDRFAAVGLVAGTGPEKLEDVCAEGEPASVISIHGTVDPLVPYEGGVGRFDSVGQVASVDALAEYWTVRDNCTSAPTEADISRTVSARTWACPFATVAFFRVDGGGHTWPGGSQYARERLVGSTDSSIDATELIWQFFSQQPPPASGQ
jgi:polyhydroxybutyrate depolymerase